MTKKFLQAYISLWGQDSTVNIETGYRLDGREVEFESW
jgi:hypothetical protein